jgi:Cu2+-exporting ATPase
LACDHCGTLVSRRAAVRAMGKAFCCNGCRTVAEIIHEGGWERFYERRDGFSPRPDGGTEAACAAFDGEAFQKAHVRDSEDGGKEVLLHVDGIRCAACTWLVERAVGSLDGVTESHLSYGTDRARVAWDPDRVSLSRIAEQITALGYRPLAVDAPVERDVELLVRLGVAAFCAANVMLMSVSIYAGWFQGMAERHAALFRWLILAVATPAALYSAEPFFSRAWAGLRHRVLQMDVPISLAVTIMYGHGVIATLLGADTYLDSMTMLIALLLVGRVLESYGRSKAREASEALLASAPETARRRRGEGADSRVEEVPSEELAKGDRILVGAGGSLPVDGRVRAGRARIDLSLITGESRLLDVGPNDTVSAGTMVVEGALEVEATAVGGDTVLARMADRVARARAGRAPVQLLADRIAPWFTAATLGIAAATFIGWSIGAGFDDALPVTIAVLVVACPCALALGTPTTLAAGIGAAARRGAYIRDSAVLHRLSEIDHVVLDKTGTLTRGQPEVVEADDEILRLATGLERNSHHPIARAILREAARRGIPVAGAEEVTEEPGRGVRGRVEGRSLALRRAGEEQIGLWDGDECLGRIRLRDRLREDSAAAVVAMGLPTQVLTGDDAATAAAIAAEAGHLPVSAELTPEEKVAWIEARQASGERVLFAGDGLNDAPALAAADVGVAMGSGTTAAILASDVVVVGSGLSPLAAALHAARLTRRTLLTTSLFSVTYNVVAVAAAVAGLINPLLAAVLMPLSSAVVVLQTLAVERRMRHGYRARTPPALTDPGGVFRVAVREGST